MLRPSHYRADLICMYVCVARPAINSSIHRPSAARTFTAFISFRTAMVELIATKAVPEAACPIDSGQKHAKKNVVQQKRCCISVRSSVRASVGAPEDLQLPCGGTRVMLELASGIFRCVQFVVNST